MVSSRPSTSDGEYQPKDKLISVESKKLASDADDNSASRIEAETRLRQLYNTSDGGSVQNEDFEVANIAREQLQKTIDHFNKEAKPSSLQHLGFTYKPVKHKVVEVLNKSTEGVIEDLKASVDDLEEEWKRDHGSIYTMFKKICGTLDDHKSILKVFPSQNDYASPLVGSITILLKAAKTHSEISLKLSEFVAEISEKVATCSHVLLIVKTSRARKRLAEIYARMFTFYANALEWYLKSKFGRLVRSFNENLVKEFEDSKRDIEDSITELYREAAIANTALTAIIHGRIASLEEELYRQRQYYAAKDVFAGDRMEKIMHATWAGAKQLESMIELAKHSQATEQTTSMQTTMCSTTSKASNLDLSAFIFENNGPAALSKGQLCVAEVDVISKLRSWMTEKENSKALWISSPYEPGVVVPSCHAVMTALAAAWQAEAPIISYFCKRPLPNQKRPGLSIEQVGLISLIYSLIHQLLQFKEIDTHVVNEKDDLKSLDGGLSSWATSLRVLRALLRGVPVVTFCVIDGLNDLELNEGKPWCIELMNTLQEQQQQQGKIFNTLYSTAGQSSILPKYIEPSDRHMTIRRAEKIRKSGGVFFAKPSFG